MRVYPRNRTSAAASVAGAMIWEIAVTGGSLLVPSLDTVGFLALGLHLIGIVVLAHGVRGLVGYGPFSEVRLALASEPVKLGEKVEVKLDLTPARGYPVARLAVHLRCHEHAVLREGSRNLDYVKKVFERTAVIAEDLSVAAGVAMSFETQLRMPGDRSATFHSANFFVDWSVDLEVEVRGMPAANRAWPIKVLPVLMK